MSRARDDIYTVAAMLADLDRVLAPLAPDESEDIGVAPPIPPPLPPVTPARGGGRAMGPGSTPRRAARTESGQSAAVARRAEPAEEREVMIASRPEAMVPSVAVPAERIDEPRAAEVTRPAAPPPGRAVVADPPGSVPRPRSPDPVPRPQAPRLAGHPRPQARRDRRAPGPVTVDVPSPPNAAVPAPATGRAREKNATTPAPPAPKRRTGPGQQLEPSVQAAPPAIAAAARPARAARSRPLAGEPRAPGQSPPPRSSQTRTHAGPRRAVLAATQPHAPRPPRPVRGAAPRRADRSHEAPTFPPPLPRRPAPKPDAPPPREPEPEPVPDVLTVDAVDEDLFEETEAPVRPRSTHLWLRGGRLRIPAPAAGDQAAARNRLARWSRRRGRRL